MFCAEFMAAAVLRHFKQQGEPLVSWTFPNWAKHLQADLLLQVQQAHSLLTQCDVDSHAAVSLQVPLAFAALFQRELNNDKMHGTTEYARAISLVSAGYFVADTSIILKHFKEHGPEPLFHAVICVTFFVYSAAKHKMQYWVPRTLMFECSTPFVHLRWLLHALGRSKTRGYKINGLAMIGAFFACRIVYGTRAQRLTLGLRCCMRHPSHAPS
jgi:TLC domain